MRLSFFLVKTSSGMSESYSSSASTAINQQSMTQSFRHGTTSTHTFSIAQPTYSQHTYDRHANNQPAHNQSTHKSIRHSSTCHVRRFDTTSHVQSDEKTELVPHSTAQLTNSTLPPRSRHSTVPINIQHIVITWTTQSAQHTCSTILLTLTSHDNST